MSEEKGRGRMVSIDLEVEKAEVSVCRRVLDALGSPVPYEKTGLEMLLGAITRQREQLSGCESLPLTGRKP